MFSNRSWKNSFSLSIAAVTLLGLSTAKVHAASDSFSLSESQKDALSCSNKTSESCEIFTTGKFSAKGLVFVGNTNVFELISAEKTNAIIQIHIGTNTFGGLVGDAAKIGSHNATFNLTDIDCAKSPCKTNVHGTVKVSLSTKGLSVAVSTKTGATANEAFENSIIANAFATNNAAFTTNIDVSVVVDGIHTDAFVVGVSGIATTKTTIKNGGTNDLDSVKLKSTGIAE
jgi:hypothetical protein